MLVYRVKKTKVYSFDISSLKYNLSDVLTTL